MFRAAAVACLMLGWGRPLFGQNPPAAPAPLLGIVVPSKVKCVVGVATAPGDLGSVWAAARIGLAAVVRTEQGRKVVMDVDLFERTYDKSGRKLVDSRITPRNGVSARPVAALSPSSFMAMGFAWVEPDGITFYAPDATMLASDEFAANYCMRLRDPAAADSVQGVIGIEFAPPPGEPNHTDIGGVLWLDRATGELVRLDYHYNRMPAEFKAPAAGGRLVFRTLPKGFAIAQQWLMRLPIVDLVERRKGGIDRYSTNREDHAEKVVPFGTVTGFREFGGIVMRADVPGAPSWTP